MEELPTHMRRLALALPARMPRAVPCPLWNAREADARQVVDSRANGAFEHVAAIATREARGLSCGKSGAPWGHRMGRHGDCEAGETRDVRAVGVFSSATSAGVSRRASVSLRVAGTHVVRVRVRVRARVRVRVRVSQSASEWRALTSWHSAILFLSTRRLSGGA